MLQRSTTYRGGTDVVLPEPTGALVCAPGWTQGGGEWPVA
jgi:hypothetical protein